MKFMVKKGLGLYCSYKCSTAARDNSAFFKAISLKGKEHHLYAEKSPRWNGGIHNTLQGYKKLRVSSGVYILEHRLVMEKILGRKLLNTEIVHHKDGDRKNNHPSNLILMGRSEHSKLHGLEKSTKTTEQKQKCKTNPEPKRT